LQRGFDKFYGTLIAAGSYWDPLTLTEGNESVKPRGDFYYTEAITDKALEYIDGNGAKPYFLYVAYTAPHWPLHARADVVEKYRGRFASGWDELRAARHERMIEMGLLSEDWQLPNRDSTVPAWEDAAHQAWQQTRMEAYAATIDHVDQGVGRIVQTLRERGELDNTVIFFLSDNGGADLEHPDGLIGSTGRPWAVMRYVPLFTRDGQPIVAGDRPGLKLGPNTTYGGYGRPWAHLSNTPFSQYKKFTREGGISTPLIVHWPDGFEARGVLRREVGHVIDLMPTCLEIAEASYPERRGTKKLKELDGVSLLPILKDEAVAERTICWEHRGHRAVRQGRWKLVASHTERWQLYDMVADRTETNDVAQSHPKIVESMKRDYEAWALRCDVLAWDDLDIPFIPPNDNPLTRTEAELDVYFEALRKRGLRVPGSETPQP
jgi:arylsulfatase